MRISILTLFPDMFTGPFDASIIKRAKEKGLIEIECITIRDFGIGNHKLVDDTPYGGGIGMVMRVDVLYNAISNVKCQISPPKADQPLAENVKCNEKVILMSASGEQFTQKHAKDFSTIDHLIIICGHYEGVDNRIMKYIDAEISIGDFVVTGGEIPAMLITDAVTRLLPNVITPGATENESFSFTDNEKPLLEYPHYTKPSEFDGMTVPEVLLSGNHKKIDEWRREEAIKKTKLVRPDLLEK